MPRVVAIVQARTGSTRLPSKVLTDIAGAPMLAWVVSRLSRATRIDDIVIATTTSASDDAIAELAARLRRSTFRGSEEDVLARYAGAARASGADVVVRITADCPLVDPALVDGVVETLLDGKADYASNTLPPRTAPHGLDVEAFTARALFEAEEGDTDVATREHVTPFLYRHPERFRLLRVDLETDLSGLRLTVDTAEDLALVRQIYASSLGEPGGYREIGALLETHPEWRALNAHVEQRRPPQ